MAGIERSVCFNCAKCGCIVTVDVNAVDRPAKCDKCGTVTAVPKATVLDSLLFKAISNDKV